MTKPVLPFLETMVTQACNLCCEGCSNYSDLSHKGYVSWEQARGDISSWLERVDIPDFGILGGEPLMHPQIEDWILGVRELMPKTQIRFTTNGLMLKEKFHIVKLLEEIGNCVFKITVHRNDSNVNWAIDKITNSYNWQPITEFGINRYTTGNRFRFHVKRPDVFWKTHIGTYEDMKPHHSSPAEAFKICTQSTCPLLYQGRIYECSSNGLLRDVLERMNWPNQEEWLPYLGNGIGSDCDDQKLLDFIDNFGKPHSMCGMCPSTQHTFSKLDHFDQVLTKKYVPEVVLKT
jgi:organic radical activating enzyme